MSIKYQLKIQNKDLDLFKLINEVRKFVNENKRSNKSSADVSNLLTKTSSWKKICEQVFKSTASTTHAQMSSCLPPSLLNKLKIIYQIFIQPYEEALLKAKISYTSYTSNLQNSSRRHEHLNSSLHHPRIPRIEDVGHLAQNSPFASYLTQNTDSNSRSSFTNNMNATMNDSNMSTSFNQFNDSMSARKPNPKYTDYLEDESDILELDKDEIDESGNFITPKRNKEDDEDDDFKWKPQHTGTASRRRGPARFNMREILDEDSNNSFAGGGDNTNDSFRAAGRYSNSNNKQFKDIQINTKIDRSKLKPFLSKFNYINKLPNNLQLLNSLESGLPNERDFALNAVALMSICQNNTPMTTLYSCSQMSLKKMGGNGDRFIDAILRHSGVNAETGTSDVKYLQTFWSKILAGTDLAKNFPQNTQTNLTAQKFQEINLRLSMILDIFRNITFCSENSKLCWENKNFRHLIYSCLLAEEPDFRKHFLGGASSSILSNFNPAICRAKSNYGIFALDILENVSRVVELSKIDSWERSILMEVLFSYPEGMQCLKGVESYESRDVYLRIIWVELV